MELPDASKIFDIKDKVAIITGASGVFGMIACKTMVAGGAKIMVTGRSEEKLKSLAEELKASGTDVAYSAGSPDKQEDVEKVVNDPVKAFGGIDTLLPQPVSMFSATLSTSPLMIGLSKKKYRQSWEGPNTKELFSKYPLQMISPHPKFSFHTMGDGKDSVINDIRDHRVRIDGWYYWIARINSADAKERGIMENDLIKLFNDRGAVICAAQISERVRSGIIHSYESCAVYAPTGKPGVTADRGGCVNTLTPSRMIVKKSHGMAGNSCLIEVCKWNGEESFS